MKRKLLFFASITFLAISFSFAQETQEPWTTKQLMDPAGLANEMMNPAAKLPLILDVGPAGSIKGSIEIGPTKEKENLDKLKQAVEKLPRDARIVIYCGCCPFKNCPNIRPAFTLLNSLGFTNHQLLNITKNLKADWIEHGYPMEPQPK